MRPTSEAELADLIRAANGPFRIRGGGTRSIGNVVGEVLETGGLSGVTLYEPAALTLVVRAGTALKEVEELLASEGQMLAFEPPDLRGVTGSTGESTIGGVVASNASGSRRVTGGACRDAAIGVRFVDGSSEIVANGGRVMKNVTGYDLVKLMTGSFGTLGVLTEVSLKTLPKPETEATLVGENLTAEQAIAAMTKALTSPWEVSGAFYLADQQRLMLRLGGFADQVAYRLGRLAGLIGGIEAMAGDPWPGIRRFDWLEGVVGDLWRVCVKPSDAPELMKALNAAGATSLACDWGGGLIWVTMPEGTDLRALMQVPGRATLMRGNDQSVFQPEPAPVARLSAGIRARFDPKCILNPGLMG